jgi:anti-anti-sigma regulatory factor
MAETADSKVVALPAIVDLDALDFVRDGLIEAVELGALTVDASQVERVSTNALFMLVSASNCLRSSAP